MPISHLQKKTHLFWITLIVLSFWFLWWWMFFLGSLIYGLLYFFFRKSHKDFLEAHIVSQGVVLSPVNGIVRSIRSKVDHPSFGQDCLEISIAVPWWKEWSVRMPVTAEVVDYQQAEQALTLMAPNGQRVGVQFMKSLFGLTARLAVLPGDRGMRVANLGNFPFGGSVLVYLLDNYEIMVNVNDQVVAGETPLAGEQV